MKTAVICCYCISKCMTEEALQSLKWIHLPGQTDCCQVGVFYPPPFEYVACSKWHQACEYGRQLGQTVALCCMHTPHAVILICTTNAAHSPTMLDMPSALYTQTGQKWQERDK